VSLLEIFLQSPPHVHSNAKCMYMVATVGLYDQIPKISDKIESPNFPSNFISQDAKAFLMKCLEVDHTKRPTAADLLLDTWVSTKHLSDGIHAVLKEIFLSGTLNEIGITN